MKCTCDRSALHEALSATAAVTLSRTPKPILQCVRVAAANEILTLTAYDQEVGLRYRVREVEVTSEGETLVNSDRLVAIVRESHDETLAFELADGLLHIRGADSHFQIVGQDVREFPPVPDMEGEPDFSVKMGELRSAAEKTLFAAARENTRYAINGVLWQKEGKRLRLVSTDGRRLALSGAALKQSGDGEISAIVPSKALGLLSRLHFNADEKVEVRVSANQIIMRTERATISSVLVEGHFPKWEDVLPRDLDKKVELATSELLSGVRRAALLANVESKGIRVEISPKTSADGRAKMILSSRSAEGGEAQVELSIDYEGEGIAIGFNPEFLIEALKVCGETTTIELKETSKPGILTSGPNFKYVVMPVNLS